MRTNINVFPLAAGLEAIGFRSGMPLQERFKPNTEVQTNDKIAGSDAYQLAVLILVAAAILSLWI